jgi:hypothetical protein
VFSLSLIPDETPGLRVEDLLRELVHQRLALGFQLVPNPTSAASAAASAAAGMSHAHSHMPGFSASPRHPAQTQVRLSLGLTFHQLSYDPFSQNVQVKRYWKASAVPAAGYALPDHCRQHRLGKI